MTAPSARVFPLTVLGLSRCCPPAVHSTLSARFLYVSLPPTVPSCAAVSESLSGAFSLRTDCLDWLAASLPDKMAAWKISWSHNCAAFTAPMWARNLDNWSPTTFCTFKCFLDVVFDLSSAHSKLQLFVYFYCFTLNLIFMIPGFYNPLSSLWPKICSKDLWRDRIICLSFLDIFSACTSDVLVTSWQGSNESFYNGIFYIISTSVRGV